MKGNPFLVRSCNVQIYLTSFLQRKYKSKNERHPELAKPLFHVLNMMDMDLSLDRWNMAKHRWDNISSFYYNGTKVHTEAI